MTTRLVLLGLLGSAVFAASANAAELCREPYRFVPGAGWQEVAAAYPKAAISAKIDEGQVVLRCLKSGNGRIERCAVKSEFPAGYGFGAAALQIVGMKRVDLSACGPQGAPREVELPVKFRAPNRFGGAPANPLDDKRFLPIATPS